jgi:hypothetical protein
MAEETKVCRGSLHLEGVELPIDKFSDYYVFYKNNKYWYKRPYCKDCMKIFYHTYNVSEEGRSRCNKYRNTEKGVINNRKCANRQHRKHPEKLYKQQVKARALLQDNYIKTLVVKNGIFISSHRDVSPEIVNLKRSQIKLYRKAKKQLKNEQN